MIQEAVSRLSENQKYVYDGICDKVEAALLQNTRKDLRDTLNLRERRPAAEVPDKILAGLKALPAR